MTRVLPHAKSLFLAAAALAPINASFPFAFLFAGDANGVAVVTHPSGYDGTGGVLEVTVGIDPTSANAVDMVTPTQNVIAEYNALQGTNGNLVGAPFGTSNNVPFSEFDFESVLLHEMGHSLGLEHGNQGFKTNVSGAATDYTQSTNGPDNAFDFNAGADGVEGTADDVRGDDVCLNYFRTANNDPFTIAATVDATTYSRDIAQLPAGDNYSAQAGRDVAAATGYGDSEAVMNQGSTNAESQRDLGLDDEAGIRYAAAGLDEAAGTVDDYTLRLVYAGQTTDADIVIDFDDSETGFAVSRSGATFLSGDHLAITNNNIYFNGDDPNDPNDAVFFFNSVPVPVSLVAFDAAPAEGGGAALTWATAGEYDHSHFELERSRDLAAWTPVGRVAEPLRETDLGQRHYGLTDAGAVAGGYYYRLHAVATDGSRQGAEAVYVDLGVASFELAVAGNPFRAGSCVELRLTEAGPVSMRLVDGQGRLLDAWTEQGRVGAVSVATERFLRLPRGAYFVTAEQGGQAVTARVMR